MSITLQTVSSGYNLSTINSNFQSLQAALNNNILWRTGNVAGEGKMSRDLDMDGNSILNIGVDLNNPDSLLTLEVADLRYYNLNGDTLQGPMNANNNRIANLAVPAAQSDAARKQDVDDEALYRQQADASLQQQIIEAAPIAAAERPIVQWHGQHLLNSVTVPDNQNAFSIGPQITIEPGQAVTLGTNSYWSILGNVFEADQLYNVTANNLKTSDGTKTISVANIANVVGASGIVPVSNGGTGATTAATARSNLGAAASGANTDITSITGSAASLTTPRTFQTNLASTSSASFNGTANVSPGITGVLGLSNGGTGGNSAAAARTNLAVVGTATNAIPFNASNTASSVTTSSVSVTFTPGVQSRALVLGNFVTGSSASNATITSTAGTVTNVSGNFISTLGVLNGIVNLAGGTSTTVSLNVSTSASTFINTSILVILFPAT